MFYMGLLASVACKGMVAYILISPDPRKAGPTLVVILVISFGKRF